jgi:hypothetical protein
MSLVGLQSERIAARYGLNIVQDAEQTLQVLRGSAMHHIEVPGRRRYTLQNCRGHSHDYDFNHLVSESKKNLAVLRVFDFHGEAE